MPRVSALTEHVCRVDRGTRNAKTVFHETDQIQGVGSFLAKPIGEKVQLADGGIWPTLARLPEQH